MKLPPKRYALLVLAATAPWILRAEDTVNQVPGVQKIHDELTVR
jgi:hypothetical protein